MSAEPERDGRLSGKPPSGSVRRRWSRWERGSMAGYVARMHRYLTEMLPVPGHLLVAAMTYFGIAAFARHVHRVATPLASLHTALGVWSVFNLFLILRLMDELKDRDVDRELFPERPLPSGRVRESDIRLSLAISTGSYLFASFCAGSAFWTALIVLGYAMLMFRLFFIPNVLRGSLMLSLVTHTPILPLMMLQGFATFAAESGLRLVDLAWPLVVPYVMMIWAVYAAWEITRKTRQKEDETEYVTYSRTLGAFGAVIFACTIHTITVGIALYFYVALQLSWAYLAVVVGGFGVMLWAYLGFLIKPAGRTPQLRPYAEVFALAVFAAQVLEFGWWQRGA